MLTGCVKYYICQEEIHGMQEYVPVEQTKYFIGVDTVTNEVGGIHKVIRYWKKVDKNFKSKPEVGY